MISLSGAAARGAAPVPTASAAPAPQAPGLGATMPPVQLGGGWESANVMPRPGNPDRTLQQGTPRALIHAAGQPRAGFSPQLPRTPEPTPERPREAFDPRATATPQPVPRADLGAQHGTALASDYLRQARDAVLGTPAAARPQSPSLPPQPTTAARYPAPSADATAPSVAPAVIAGGGLPPTAELPAMADFEPVRVPPVAYGVDGGGAAEGYRAAPPVATSAAERFGTQASVAPPPLDPDPARLPPPPAASQPPLAAAPMAAMAAVPAQLQSAAPRSLAGTMLEPPPSAKPSASPATSSTPPSSLASRFEQVPAARVPLAEQGSSALQIPIDHSLAEWNQTNAGKAGLADTQARAAKSTGGSQGRLIGLGVLAVLAIGFASFGDQLLGKSQKQQHPVHPRPSATPADVALAPASPNPSAARMPNSGGSVNTGSVSAGSLNTASVSATTASLTAAPTPALAPASTAHPSKAGPDVAPAEAAAKDEDEAPESPREKAAAAERSKAAEAKASPEELAAANAARNVITGRYADALPLYNELARSYPQNTAYAAMARVLKQKTETSAPAVAPRVTP
jgi:hypothetical protein